MSDDTIVRAITFPVVEPVGRTWKEFRAALQACWRESTSLANWAITELLKQERLRRPDDRKISKAPVLYLYGHAKKNFWGWGAWAGCYQSANCVLRQADKKWRSDRYKVMWTGDASAPTFRYPHPYPVHNQAWSPEFDEGNRPIVRVSLHGETWTLRLRGGPEFARQLAGFRQILAGAKKGELAIFRRGREGHVMLKMVAHFPKPEAKSGHTLLVRTDPEHFWVCEREGRAAWIVNADHVKRWIAAHKDFLQRLSEDTKYEKRWPARMRENMNKARELRCRKHHDRIDTWCHQATAMLVEFCRRQGAAEVIYDDECQEYLPSFPWHNLKTKLGYKLEAAGITLTAAASKEDECVGSQRT